MYTWLVFPFVGLIGDPPAVGGDLALLSDTPCWLPGAVPAFPARTSAAPTLVT